MVDPSGHYRLVPDSGRIVLHTSRDGLAATAGHDLTIDVPRWSGDLVVNDDGTPVSLAVRIDVGALTVRGGTGGLKPLTDRDRREIGVTMRRLLETSQYPEAVFIATRFEPRGDGAVIEGAVIEGAVIEGAVIEGAVIEGAVIEGDFTLRGATRPLKLEVTQTGPGTYKATGTVVQSSYGIKPYTGFFGALKVRDAVAVEAEVELPAPGDD
jgi:polyisoprenoid-binding protein YceI